MPSNRAPRPRRTSSLPTKRRPPRSGPRGLENAVLSEVGHDRFEVVSVERGDHLAQDVDLPLMGHGGLLEVRTAASLCAPKRRSFPGSFQEHFCTLAQTSLAYPGTCPTRSFGSLFRQMISPASWSLFVCGAYVRAAIWRSDDERRE